MSDEEPWKDECDTCDHERWNHGEDGQCGYGGDCTCQKFLDEERDTGLAYWRALLAPEPVKLGDVFQPVDRSWWDAMSDASKLAYLTYLKRPLNAVVVSDEVTEGLEAVMAIGSPTVDDWYLSLESPDCPDRERLR